MNNLEKWLHGIKWANIGMGLVHLIVVAGGIIPANPYLIAAQAVIAALVPGVIPTQAK